MQVQIEEHEFKWVIPEFRLGPSFNQTLEFCYDNRKIVMVVDLWSGKVQDKNERYIYKTKPLVFFKEAPRSCLFSFLISTDRGDVINYINYTKMEANKSYQPLSDRFIDSYNFNTCSNRGRTIFNIEITVKKQHEVKIVLEKSLYLDFQQLFNDRIHSDLTFIIDGEDVKAHKAVMAARSQVFRNMFIKNPMESKFVISDTSKEVFIEVLRFVYSEHCENFDNMCFELLEAADRYEIFSLKQICELQLTIILTKKNANEIFQLGHRAKSKDLQLAAFKVIKQTFSRCGRKMSSKFVDEPEKVQRAIDLMKELDDLLKIHPKIKGPDIEKKVKFAEQVRIIEGTDGGTSGEDEEPKNRPLLDTFRELVSEII